MANQAEKKRSERERLVGGYYSSIASVCMIVWIIRHVLHYYKGSKDYTYFGYFWRFFLIFIGYSNSLSSIYQNLKLGLDYSLSNDLFIVTTAVSLVTLFYEFGYKIFIVVPAYGVYRGCKAIYAWATTPEPELQPQEEHKQRVKYRTVRR